MLGAPKSGKVVPAAAPDGMTAADRAKKKAKRLKGKRKKSSCRCPSYNEARESIPTFEEFIYRTRYCKYSFTCKMSWIGILLALGLVFCVLGGALPALMTRSFEQGVIDSFDYSNLDQWASLPRVAAAFGGEDSLSMDTGEQVTIVLSDVTNAEEVLQYGARPQMRERGPYIIREYMQRHNATEDFGTVQFTERRFHTVVDAQLNEIVTVANPAYRYVEALMRTTPEIAKSTFEEGSVAVLGSWGMRKLRLAFGPLIKQAAFPALAQGVFDALRDGPYGGSRSGLLAYWRTSGELGRLPTGLDHCLRLPAPRDGNTSTPITDLVAQAMWTWTDTYAMTSPQGWQWYLLPVSTQRVQEWAAHYGAIERTYLADLELAKRHATQIGDWLKGVLANTIEHRDAAEEASGTLTAGGPPRPSELQTALDFEDRAAGVLETNGILPRANWSLVIGAQVGSNSVMGFAFKQLSDNVGGGTGDLWLTTGTGLSNQCPESASTVLSGSSINDYEAAREAYVAPAIAELSCWSSRVLPTPGDSQTDTYYSKIDPDRMSELLRLFTTGTSVSNFNVPGSRLLQQIVDAIDQLDEAVSVRNSIFDLANEPNEGLYSWVSRLRVAQLELAAAAPGSPEETAAEAQVRAVSEGHQRHLRSSDVGLVNAVCNAGFLPLRMRDFQLSCYQAIDLVNFFRYFAREFVWKPNFVWRSPDGRVDPGNMRGGPFIKASVSEVLYGLQDQFFYQMFGSVFPGLGPSSFPNEAQWRARQAASADQISVRTGSTSGDGGGVALSRHMYKLNGELETTTWITSMAVQGSYDYSRFPPLNPWDRLYQQEGGAAPAGAERTLSVWNPRILRPETFAFLGEQQGELLRSWRFERLSAVEASPFLRSDVLKDAPFCLRSLAELPGPIEGSTLGMDFMYGPPYLHGCSADQTRIFAYAGSPATTNTSHGSFMDVEPVTGRTLRAVHRHGLFLRWQPTQWYPRLRPTIGSLAYITRERQLHPQHQLRIREDLEQLNYVVDVAVPVSMFFLGSLAIVGGSIILYFYVYPCPLPGHELREAARQSKRKREREAKRRRQEELRKARADPTRMLDAMVPGTPADAPPPSRGRSRGRPEGPLQGADSRADDQDRRSVSFAPEEGTEARVARSASASRRSNRSQKSSREELSRPVSQSGESVAGSESKAIPSGASSEAREGSEVDTEPQQTVMGSKIGKHLGKAGKAQGRSLIDGRRALQAAQAAHATGPAKGLGDSSGLEGSDSAQLRDSLMGELTLQRQDSSKKERADERRQSRQQGSSSRLVRQGSEHGGSGPAVSSKRGKFGGVSQVV